jgi:energy-coupling factor transporter ATP-binding protein EcfA2
METTERVRLMWLKVDRFRKVRPGTELRFSPGHNVIIGQNGSGKTNLLKLIAAVVSGEFDEFAEEPLELSWEVVAGEWRATFELRQRGEKTERDPSATFHGADRPIARWTWEVKATVCQAGVEAVTMNAVPSRVDVHDRRDGRKGTYNARWGADLLLPIRLLLSAWLTELGSPSINALPWRFWHAHQVCRLDEGIDAFRWVTKSEGNGTDYRADLYHAELILAEPGVLIPGTSDNLPHALVQALTATDATSLPTHIELDAKTLSFLDEFRELTGFRSTNLLFQVLRSDGQVATYGPPDLHVTTRDGTTLHHTYLSYGQKRLFAFLFHRALSDDIFIADELVNGLHHVWLRWCIESLSDHQTFLTSQNPLLLDYLTFDTVEDVQRKLVICEISTELGEAWTWTQLAEEEAESFLSAYDVGIQHVSELLRTRGIW